LRYRFGFNTQEKDDEIYGEGNANTAEFWEYDARLGRRWNVDPIVKQYQSGYSSFSNNPLIFIDPNGNTDFYNMKGKKIGSDGDPNGDKLIILSKSTQREIKKEVRKNSIAVLSENQLKSTIPVPTNEIMQKIEDTFKKTESSGNSEHGFIVGTKDGEQVSSNVYAGTGGSSTKVPKFDPASGVKELYKKGAIPQFIVHSHPNVLKFNNPSQDFETSEHGSSIGDRTYNASSIFADILLEVQSNDPYNLSSSDKNTALSRPGTWIPRTDSATRVITFYNTKRNLQSMKFSKFNSLVKKINSTK